MKTFIRAFMLITCILVFNSFVSATSVNVTPSFNFEYKDNPPPFGISYLYTISYGIENWDGTNGSPWGPWPIGIGTPTTGYKPGITHTFTDGNTHTIYYPTVDPSPEKCFRIIVRVERFDGTYTVTRYGLSDWADVADLEGGDLEIHVNPF